MSAEATSAKYSFEPAPRQRAAMGAATAAACAAAAAFATGGHIAPSIWVVACAIAACWCMTDVKARLLPWELALAFLAVGLAWQAALPGPASIPWALAVGAFCAAIFAATGKVFTAAGRACAVGKGDVRLSFAVGAACGPAGLAAGVAAALIFLAAWLAAMKLKGSLDRATRLPMGPLFAAWALVGMASVALC